MPDINPVVLAIWMFVLMPLGIGLLLLTSGYPEWGTVISIGGALLVLSVSFPYIVLFCRNPTGKRSGSFQYVDDVLEAWNLVFLKKQALLNRYAYRVLYNPMCLPASEEVLNWYGKDVLRVATRMASSRRGLSGAPSALAAFAQAGITDFDRMLDYIEALGAEAALSAIQHDIPLEYAKAMLPTGTHD